ncbi:MULTISPECIES: hypothetical protein [Pseudomonas]|uniref:hypothetical protein n=1 Tax=Pseudomonas TaxID=286 RepID=UPI001E2FF19A|nr:MULTISPECIES: hypothetical protein [Pseudomonas]MCD4530151.1 hypothetical protein [Pseudomonas sp. C3-2018]
MYDVTSSMDIHRLRDEHGSITHNAITESRPRTDANLNQPTFVDTDIKWNDALQVEATRAGYNLAEAQAKSLEGKDGVGIKINVSNFRYLTPGARYGAGVMVGNAWVNSSADYSDLKTGRLIGTRTYDTSSSAWEGVMSAMTQEQVQAISQKIIADIKNAKLIETGADRD